MTQEIRIIVADDHEAVRSGVLAILSTDPELTVVAEASDGFEAVQSCVAHQPDVALLDLRMPGKDGIWATERITSETQARVLVLTTYDSDDLVAEALAAGAHGYLLKSTSGTELIQAVRHVAADRHVLDPAVTGSVISQLTATPPPAPGRNVEDLGLTQREAEVLLLLAEGFTNQQIASRLAISLTTVKTHVRALYAKTSLESRVALGRLGAGIGNK